MVFLAGCSDADPQVSLLRTMSEFEFVTNSVVTASLNSVPLTAKCSSFINKVELTFDDGATWIPSSTYDASSTSCANSKFDLTVTNNSAPLNGMTINSGDSITVKFRAYPRIGTPVTRTVTIKYTPSATIKQSVLAGTGEQSGTGYILKGHVQAHKQQVATGTNLILKGRILQ
jgi:hypothetical protein